MAGCYRVACATTQRAWIGLRGRPGVVTGAWLPLEPRSQVRAATAVSSCVASGQYCFEVKITEGLLRVGWSSSTASLALGTAGGGEVMRREHVVAK